MAGSESNKRRHIARKQKGPRRFSRARAFFYVCEELLLVFLLFLHFFGLFLLRLLFFFLQLGAEELKDGELRSVSYAPPDPDDTCVPAGAIRETRCKVREELLRGLGGLKKRRSLPPRVKRIALAERDHAFGQRASCFGAPERGVDPLLFDQVRDQIAQHRAPVRGVLSELGS